MNPFDETACRDVSDTRGPGTHVTLRTKNCEYAGFCVDVFMRQISIFLPFFLSSFLHLFKIPILFCCFEQLLTVTK